MVDGILDGMLVEWPMKRKDGPKKHISVMGLAVLEGCNNDSETTRVHFSFRCW